MAESVVRMTVGALARAGSLQFSDGYRTKKPEHGPGLPILRVGDIGEGVIAPSFKDSVREEFRPRMAGKTSRSGDVLLTTKGTVGRVAFVPGDLPEHVYSPQLCFLRVVDLEAIDPYWLYAWARSPECQVQVHSRAGQTDMAPYLSLADLKDLVIGVPPIREQRGVGATLRVLDDLIDTNRQLAGECHAVSAAIVAAACETGARRMRVSEVATFENRHRVPLSAKERAAMPGPFPYYGATGQMGTVGRFLFDGVRVLVGEDGTVVRDDGTPIIQLVWGRYWVNNHAHVLRGTGCSTALLRIALEACSVAGVVTGAVQAKLSMGNLRSVELRLPANPAIDERIQELTTAEQGLLDEAAELNRTRDELLPLLMSGRVRPREVAL